MGYYMTHVHDEGQIFLSHVCVYCQSYQRSYALAIQKCYMQRQTKIYKLLFIIITSLCLSEFRMTLSVSVEIRCIAFEVHNSNTKVYTGFCYMLRTIYI